MHGRYSLQEQTQPFPRAQWWQINFFQLASTWLDKLVTREIQRHQNEEHLVRVPQRVEITSLPCDPENSTTLEISCNDSILKALVAMCQLLYAAWELYDARGRQMDTFGYAAYSLTTIPYALMSFVNLWATFLAPQYSCLFLVLRESQTNSTDEQSDKQGMSVHTHDVSTEDINNRMKGAVGVIDNWPEKVR